MKRTPLRRNTPLKRGGPLRRGKRLNPFGRRARRDRKAGNVFGPLCDFVREWPCCLCGAHPPSDPHHVRSRGAGFRDWLEDGTGNVVALCRPCHNKPIDRKTRLYLIDHARQLGESFIQNGGDRCVNR